MQRIKNKLVRLNYKSWFKVGSGSSGWFGWTGGIKSNERKRDYQTTYMNRTIRKRNETWLQRGNQTIVQRRMEKWNNDKDCQHPKSYSFQTATTLNIKQMNLIQNVSKVIIHSWFTIITRSTKDFNLDINRFNNIAKCDFITNTANLEHAANQKHTRQIELQIMVHSWIWFIKLKLNGKSGELVAWNLMKRNGIIKQLIWTERYEREMKLDCNAEIKQSFNEEWNKWYNDKDCQHPKSYSFQTAITLNIKQMNLIQNVSKVIIHSWISIITSTKDFNLDINRFSIIGKCDFITNTSNLENAANQKQTRQIELQIMVQSWIWFIRLIRVNWWHQI